MGETTPNASELLEESGRDARGPGKSSHRAWHHRGYLPHFDAGAVVQMITFRLADSLPRDVYERICDGARYRLIRWVVMPNHVHVLIEQIDGHSLSHVVQAWKSFSAKKINNIRNANGSVWAADYFDRYIRNRQHFGDVRIYIDNNPVKAGLANKPEEWPFSSAAEGAGGTPSVPGSVASALAGLL